MTDIAQAPAEADGPRQAQGTGGAGVPTSPTGGASGFRSKVPRPTSAPRIMAGDRRVRPFLVGTAVGGVTGAVVGTLLSQSTRRLLVGLIQLVTRRLTDDERDELRFELLLQ